MEYVSMSLIYQYLQIQIDNLWINFDGIYFSFTFIENENENENNFIKILKQLINLYHLIHLNYFNLHLPFIINSNYIVDFHHYLINNL